MLRLTNYYIPMTLGCLFVLTLSHANITPHRGVNSDADGQYWTTPNYNPRIQTSQGTHYGPQMSYDSGKKERVAAAPTKDFSKFMAKLDASVAKVDGNSARRSRKEESSLFKTALNSVDKEAFTPGNIGELEKYLKNQFIPPAGWKSGDGNWRMARWELLKIIRDNRPLWEDVMIPFFVGTEPKLLQTYFNKPITPLKEIPSHKGTLDLAAVSPEGLAYYAEFRKNDLSPAKKQRLVKYMEKQKALPEIFPNTASNRNAWQQFRAVLMKNNEHLASGLQSAIDRRNGVRPTAVAAKKNEKPKQTAAAKKPPEKKPVAEAKATAKPVEKSLARSTAQPQSTGPSAGTR